MDRMQTYQNHRSHIGEIDPYRLERLSNRLAKGGKVRFVTLLRKTYKAQ
jgi:hypothetical protein